MRRVSTITVQGARDSDEFVQRLEGTARRAGWQPLPSPGAFLFAPPGRTKASTLIGVWRDPATSELRIAASDDHGQPVSTTASLLDGALGAFMWDVVVPIAEAVRAPLTLGDTELQIEDLVPEAVAASLFELVREEERRGGRTFHAATSEHFLRAVALLHVADAALDGPTLALWLAEDAGWPERVARSLGKELDEGLAYLREHDHLEAWP